MAFFKKKITEEQFVAFLLGLAHQVENEVIKTFNKEFEYTGDDKGLKWEAKIFSLWLITLSAPPNNNKIKDLLHDKRFEYLGLDENTKKFFFEELEKRYKNYYEAFNIWQKNPQSGHMIGSVMVEIIKNQNPDFSLKEKIPLVGDVESFQASVLFSSLFMASLESIGNLKKEFKLDHIMQND